MYIDYHWNAGATFDEIFDDFANLLTGDVTLVANLSASCNKVSTTIDSTVDGGTANRSMEDNAELDKRVVRVASTYVDTPKDYFIRIHRGTGGGQAQSNVIMLDAYGTWNNITHTSDNTLGFATPWSAGGQTFNFDPSSAGSLQIFILPTFFGIGNKISGAGNVVTICVFEAVPYNEYNRVAGYGSAVGVMMGNVSRWMYSWNASTQLGGGNVQPLLTATYTGLTTTSYYPPSNNRQMNPINITGNANQYGEFGMMNPNEVGYLGIAADESEWTVNGKVYRAMTLYGGPTKVGILKSQ